MKTREAHLASRVLKARVAEESRPPHLLTQSLPFCGGVCSRGQTPGMPVVGRSCSQPPQSARRCGSRPCWFSCSQECLVLPEGLHPAAVRLAPTLQPVVVYRGCAVLWMCVCIRCPTSSCMFTSCVRGTVFITYKLCKMQITSCTTSFYHLTPPSRSLWETLSSPVLDSVNDLSNN